MIRNVGRCGHGSITVVPRKTQILVSKQRGGNRRANAIRADNNRSARLGLISETNCSAILILNDADAFLLRMNLFRMKRL